MTYTSSDNAITGRPLFLTQQIAQKLKLKHMYTPFTRCRPTRQTNANINKNSQRSVTTSTYDITTNSMKQSPSCENKNYPTNQEIPRSLRIPTVHFHVHKSPPLFLSQMNPVQGLPSCIFMNLRHTPNLPAAFDYLCHWVMELIKCYSGTHHSRTKYEMAKNGQYKPFRG
jgi:hypothetical protein